MLRISLADRYAAQQAEQDSTDQVNAIGTRRRLAEHNRLEQIENEGMDEEYVASN